MLSIRCAYCHSRRAWARTSRVSSSSDVSRELWTATLLAISALATWSILLSIQFGNWYNDFNKHQIPIFYRKRCYMNLARIAGIAAALVIVAGVLMNWADMKRYIKIESM